MRALRTVGCQVGEIAVGAGTLGVSLGALEHLETHLPTVAMKKVMGEFFTDGDISGDAAVEVIEGVSANDRRHGRTELRQVLQDRGAELQVNTAPPGEGVMGDEKKRHNGAEQANHEKYVSPS